MSSPLERKLGIRRAAAAILLVFFVGAGTIRATVSAVI